MKSLSSDQLYYNGLIGLIISPIISFFFFNAMLANDNSVYGRVIVYSLLGLLYLFQAYKAYNTKRILYNKKTLIIETYFTHNKFEVLATDVISIKPVFNISKFTSMPDRRIKSLYKMKYNYNGKVLRLYFFKNSEIDDVTHFFELK